jgi:hypothetical protein
MKALPVCCPVNFANFIEQRQTSKMRVRAARASEKSRPCVRCFLQPLSHAHLLTPVDHL